MTSPLSDIDIQLEALLEDDHLLFENTFENLIMWMKYPNILDWLGYYLISEYFGEHQPLPADKHQVEYCVQSLYLNIERQSSPLMLYLIMKSMCKYYESNWTKLSQEPSGV